MPATQPVTQGISSVSALLSWQPSDDPFAVFNIASVPLTGRDPFPTGPLLHNCQGLDCQQYPPQGGTQNLLYAFGWWQSVDSFTFFGGPYKFGIPSPGWTNAAHRNGVPMLGGFFAAPGDVETLVASADLAVTQMVNVAMFYGFDGWFFNVEESTSSSDATELIALIGNLRATIHSKIPGSLIIWYDAMTKDGYLGYQNELDGENAPFLDVSDGLFTNYAWTSGGDPSPQNSVTYADQHDENPLQVYTGIDCYGRESGSTGFQTFIPTQQVATAGTSVGLFCPGWTSQNADTPLNGVPYPAGEAVFWNPIQNIVPARVATSAFPFVTHFDQGYGGQFVVDGQITKGPNGWSQPWINMSQQDVLPSWRWALTDGSSQSCNLQLANACPFDGGSNLQINGDPTVSPPFATYRLYNTNLTIGSDPLTASFTWTPAQLTSGQAVSVYPDVAIALLFSNKTALVLLSGPSSPCNGQGLGPDGYSPTYLDPTSTQVSGAGAAGTSVLWNVATFDLGAQYEGNVITEIRLLAAWTPGPPDQPVPYVDWSSVGEIKLLSGTPSALGAVTDLAAEDISWKGSTVTLNLSWTPPSGTTIRQYDIYANGQWIGRAFTRVFWVAAAVAPNGGDSVTFGVRCADTYGQFEDLSSMATLPINQ